MEKTKITFSFGRNWVDYVNNFLDEKILNTVKESLLKYLPEDEYRDKTFIDIGCGSGIFSFNALRLGCKKVISFDIDKYSIEATRIVKEKFSHLLPKNYQWEIFEGSILDEDLVNKLKGQGDIVYSWGVLHHTGDMKRAIQNAAKMVSPNGYFIIAIYNRVPSSEFWLRVKKFYNQSSLIIKKIMVYSVFILGILKRKLLGQATESLFSRERGMSIFYDVIDWLGGYPYEYATFEEIKNFVEKLGFDLIKAPKKLPSPPKTFLNRFSPHYTGNNEFIFRKK